ncbi:hypothetical protein VIGAN_09224000 [Vigna angularis var. angularis]|uniref:Uncharacterized protein n=1 Tax=Vigna angularis var. angularis TaxID=157739 RepID=A0A0S3T0H6_PHAAN|nr:hypothetical protein VIGAN_09224000 [Vigna angularis var. angularis]
MTNALKKTNSKTLTTLSLTLTCQKDNKPIHTIADKTPICFTFHGPSSTFGAVGLCYSNPTLICWNICLQLLFLMLLSMAPCTCSTYFLSPFFFC